MQSEHDEGLAIPIQLTHGYLMVSMQIELSDAVLVRFRRELLERTRREQPKGVIFDVSGLVLFDSSEFSDILRTIKMVRMMGCPSILVGIQPGMAASIAEMDIACDDLLTARSLEEAFLVLGRLTTQDA